MQQQAQNMAGKGLNLTKVVEDMMPQLVEYGLRVLGVLLLLWIASKVAAWLGEKLAARMEGRGVEKTVATFLGAMVRYLILAAAVLSCLSLFGVEATSFAALLGAAGLAVGLAFQGTLSNFAAGVMLLVFRPFKVDDVITAGGQTGKVVDLGLFVTALDTPDNRRIIVPNKAIADGVIENVTHHDIRRADVKVGVDYSADMQKTREVLEKAAQAVEGRLDDPGHQVVLTNLGDSALDWQVRIWCKTEDYFAVLEAGTVGVKKALDEAGIGIPFPQMDVHVDGSVGRAA